MIKHGLTLVVSLLILNIGCKTTTEGENNDKLNEQEAVGPDTTEVETSTDTENCSITIVESLPSSGAVGWHYRDPIQITFSDMNPTVEATLTNSAGEEVAVTSTWDDVRLNMQILPEVGYFSPNESYRLQVALCGSTPNVDFTISEVGTALGISESDLIGNTYAIDLRDAYDVYPPQASTLFAAVLSTESGYFNLLLGVSSISPGESIDFRATLGVDVGTVSPDWQITSNDRWLFEGAEFAESPYFEASTDMLEIDYQSAIAYLNDFSISGVFTPDGEKLVAIDFTTLADTRDLHEPFEPSAGDEWICETILAPVGIECEPCADDKPYCVYVQGKIASVDRIPFNINDNWE